MRIMSDKFLGMAILLTNLSHPPSNGLYQYGICAFQTFIFLQKKNFFNLFSSPIKGKSKDFISLQKMEYENKCYLCTEEDSKMT